MKRITFLFTLLVICCTSFAQKNEVYKTVTDIPYTASNDAYAKERCKLDVYYPEGKKDCQVVVWYHGGGIEAGNKEIPEELKEKGCIVVAPNYRLLPKVTVDAPLSDVAESLAWTLKNIANYGGDVKQIYVAGHSAGGYLLEVVGLDKSWMQKFGEDPDKLKALVPFSGQMITHYNHRKMQGIGPLQPVIDKYAPLYHVRKDCPPMLIISGDRELELFGRYEEQAYMYRMMKLAGHENVYLYELGGHDHGAMVHPGFHILLEYMKKNK